VLRLAGSLLIEAEWQVLSVTRDEPGSTFTIIIDCG
jgi:hypothetical protein